MSYELSEEEKELIWYGLIMRKSYIETGDALMSAEDAKNLGKHNKIRALNSDQIKLIYETNQLIKKLGLLN